MNSKVDEKLDALLDIQGEIFRNLPVQKLMEESILKGEGKNYM